MEKNIKTSNYYSTPVINAGAIFQATNGAIDFNTLRQNVFIKSIFCCYQSFDNSTGAYYANTSLRVQIQKNSGNLPIGNALQTSSGNDNSLWIFLNNNCNINLDCNYQLYPGDRLTVNLVARQDIVTANSITFHVSIIFNYYTE